MTTKRLAMTLAIVAMLAAGGWMATPPVKLTAMRNMWGQLRADLTVDGHRFTIGEDKGVVWFGHGDWRGYTMRPLW